MAVQQATMQHSVNTTNIADLLERVLDKGIVIAGDIRVKLVDIELLTIQLRLVVCSVEKAKEMGIDWWNGENFLSTADNTQEQLQASLTKIEERLGKLETQTKQSLETPAAASEKADKQSRSPSPLARIFHKPSKGLKEAPI
jgi:hypothetical protein